MALEKDHRFSMVFNESWLESYWKSMARIVSSNKSSVAKKKKKPSGIRTRNHWRKEENPRKDFFKSSKTLENDCSKSQRWEAVLLTIVIVKIVRYFSIFHSVRIILSFPLLFILIFSKFNLSFSKLIFVFCFWT